jgi:hypothetical protein
MLFIHPVIQLLAIFLAFYVFYLGVERFRMLHLHQRVAFKWKRHVGLGLVALATLLAGMLGGMSMAYLQWRSFLITGTHANVALVMAPLILFGLLSGLYMDRKKRKRRVLPLIHGLNNVTVLILALVQMVTGWWILKTFVLGI